MKSFKQTLSLLLTIAALAVNHSAMAANTWTISSSTSGTYTTFTISRSGNTAITETVLYRFIGLSAYAGQHFKVSQINGGAIATSQQIALLSGSFTFAATETSKTVTIEEMTASNDAYIFQNGTSRSYKLEVTDQGGFLLKDCTRSFNTGTSVPSSGAFNVKDITIRSGEISVTDAGYAQGYHSMTVDNYFNNAAPKAYFQHVGAQLRMTLTFQCKEVDDGWQYVQIYANQSTSNIDTGAGDGNPGSCSYAKYVAGFEHKDSKADTEYKSYTFPVTSAGNNAGADNPWGHGTGYNLHKQIFNNSRASDGRLIIPLDLTSLYVRYNASGSDNDDWVAKNTVAHIQAIDATAPTALDLSVAPGYHAKGNTVYVSVAFKEIVTSSSAKLTTNWGTLSYNTGSGSNVLTFKGTIGNSVTGSLNITGYSGTITDLAGNNFTGTITGSNLCALDANYNYPITYDLDGGSVATANPTTYTYETATFTLNNPTRTGYTFDGWTGSNGTTASTDVQIAQYSHGDKSYTANWTIKTYNITYEGLDGATFTTTNNTYTIESPDITLDTPTKTGYTFTGWTGSNGTTPETTVTIPAGSTEDKSYTANWTINTYNITYNGLEGATFTTTNNTYTVESPNITLDTPTKTGYTFDGWTGSNGTTPETAVVISTGSTEDKSYTANWTINTYNITYEGLDGATFTTTNNTYTIESPDITLDNPTKTGYTFTGWTGSNGNTPDTNVGISTGSTEDKSYTANWRTNTYTVHFDANGGSGNMSDMSFTYNEAQNLTANTFKRIGCTFAGWSTTSSGNVEYTDGQSVSNLTPDDGATFTLYAQWTDFWGTAGGADGTEEHPYIITTTAGLDMLATYVNNGTSEFPDTYFKLGADITYTHGNSDTENNYTAIGRYTSQRAFCGNFDGDGHTISGIRIYKPNTDDYQGLFGRVYGATVKNVILNDARITGSWNVGGISGQINGNSTIENCLVLNTSIIADTHGGAVIGDLWDGTLNNNYYYNCSLTQDGTTRTTNIGRNTADCDGARSAHTLTLPANVSVSAATESVTYNNVTYYASNSTVTLSNNGSAPIGYSTPFIGYRLDGVAFDGNTFTMPAADATVTAAWTDVWGIAGGADGTEQHPYTITTTAGLDLLATYVNNGISEFPDTYFKLGADITYTHGDSDTENNYTAIGYSEKAFCGNFDGDGHAVSGIRIYKPSEIFQGLFGRVYGAAIVKNVIINDACITGYDYVAGISGQINGNSTIIPAIQNCLVLNSSFTAICSGGAVIGDLWDGTLNNNHYHNCSLTLDGTTKTTDIGIENNDSNGARSVHTLTLPANVTATGESVTYNNVTYYASNSTVTLAGTEPTGHHLVYSATAGTIDGAVLTMPATDTEVTASLVPNTYTVAFNKNLDNATGTMSDQTLTYDEAQNLTANAFTCTGYIFNGWSTTPSGSVEYTDGQSVKNLTDENGATITLYANWTDVWGIAGGANGTEQKPYTITTTAGLDLLATEVNNGNRYNGKHFVLDDDITYTHGNSNTENNFTAIGCSSQNSFAGIFDGKNKTISGIRIYKEGTDDSNDNQGLFGYIYLYATVKNVILTDAVITGRQNVGGIVGYLRSYSAIDNCTVTNSVTINTVVNQSFYHGGIAGFSHGTITRCTSSARLTITSGGGNTYGGIVGYTSNASINNNLVIGAVLPQVSDVHAIIATDNNSTTSANYYRDVTIGTTTNLANIFTLALPANVTATGESVTYNNVTYYASTSTVTLSPAIGYILTDVTVNGTAATNNGNGTWTFTMPAADATVSATLSEDPNTPVAILNDGSTSYYLEATYTTAEAALRAALDDAANASGSTVTLFRDVTLATDYIECMSGTYTLDLNGHSITGSDGVLTLGGANITLIDGSSAKTGSITDTGSNVAIEMIEGTLNCTGCTISSNLSTGTGVEYIGGTLTLTDCTITGNIALLKETYSSNITLTNCTITGTSYGILRRDGVILSLTDCTITGNVGIAYMNPPSSGSYGSQSFIGNNTIKGCAFAGILIESNIKFKNLPHFGTGSDANGCDIAFTSNGTINFTSTFYYDVPATPLTVKAVEWDYFADAYVDREVDAGAGSYTFATDCDNIKYPNTSTTIPIEEVFVSLNSDYIVRTPIYHTSSYNYSSNNSSPAQLTKPVILNDNANNNASTIENFHDEDCAVTLQGRTLYKDGYWNTLCLPFRIDNISKTPLEGAEIRSLSSASLSTEGTLTLNFSNPVTALVAGTPYIIKWTRANDYVDDDAHNLVNPLFSSVCVYDETHDFTGTDGTVQFKGTYAPINFTDTDQSILFMGADNTLYYPASGAYINAFRAYFQLTDGQNSVRSFVLNFGTTDDDEDPTAIQSQESRVKSQESDVWYDLQGRKISNLKSQISNLPKGIYIHNGKKVLIK